jgi:hypothetical protein
VVELVERGKDDFPLGGEPKPALPELVEKHFFTRHGRFPFSLPGLMVAGGQGCRWLSYLSQFAVATNCR